MGGGAYNSIWIHRYNKRKGDRKHGSYSSRPVKGSQKRLWLCLKKKKSFKRQAEMVSEERHVTFNFLQNDRGSGESGGTMRQNWQ